MESRKKPLDPILDDSLTYELIKNVDLVTNKAKGTFIIYAGWGNPAQPFTTTDADTCWILSHNGKRVDDTALHLMVGKGM